MPQDNNQNRPYIRDRHEDFQLVEVEEILRHPDQSKIMSEPPILPKGGEVYLYRPNTSDKRVRDQYWWVNRGNNFHSKGQKRPSIMKTYFSLKDRSGGRKSDCLNGFRRHLYRLADARDEDAIIFVHYLGDETLHKPMPHGNTKDWWYKETSASSRDKATKIPEVPVTAALEFPGVNATTVGTGQGQSRIITGYSTTVGSNQGSVSVEARAPSNVLSAKPGVSSSLSDKIRHILDTNNRKRSIPSWNSNNKMETNKGANDPHFLHNNSSKKVKVNMNSAPNGQQMPQMSRTGQHDVKPPIQTYLHHSMSSPLVSRRIRMSTPINRVVQQSRPQRVFNLARQQVKPVSLIKNTNSPQLSARTQEQRQQQMKMRHLGNSLPSVTKTRMPTDSQVILHEALQQEPGNRNYVSQNDQTLNRGQDMSENSLLRHSNYILQDSQPVTSAKSSLQNSSYSENPVSDDTMLPMDYEKLFEEASKLPRMGCNVFVLVSYPGCKPAYWGTEKYVKKFENSDCLLPFSASGCLSIKMRGSLDKQNLLANNLDHTQPMQQQLDELDSSGSNPNLNFVIKEESREPDEDEELVVVKDIVKQELPETEDDPTFVANNQRRTGVMTQRPDNSLVGRTDSQSLKNYYKRNRQYQKQLDTSNLFSGMNSYDFSTDTKNRLGNRSTIRDKEVTNFYDQTHVYRDEITGDTGGSSGQSSSVDQERVSADESRQRLPVEIEPSGILIKIEPQTDDYGDINNLVYTEYG